MVELVKKTITGHMRTPIRKANDGQRYARQGRRRQTSSPTTASASSRRPMIRKPVANHQWTNSAFGSILCLFEVLDQGRRDEDGEAEPDKDHVERRLGEQPPEPLPVRMQNRQPVRLEESPRDAPGDRPRPQGIDRPGPQRSSS